MIPHTFDSFIFLRAKPHLNFLGVMHLVDEFSVPLERNPEHSRLSQYHVDVLLIITGPAGPHSPQGFRGTRRSKLITQGNDLLR